MNLRLSIAFVAALALSAAPRSQQSSEASADQSSVSTWDIDSEHSAVLFKVKNRGVSYVWGRFRTVEGTLDIDEQDFTKSELHVRVAADSLDSNSARRDAHLEGPDFFDVKEFPELSFKSVDIHEVGPDSYAIHGGLEMRQVARPVTFTIERTGTREIAPGVVRTGAETTFTVDRREWGMNNMLDSIDHEVTLVVNIEAQKRR